MGVICGKLLAAGQTFANSIHVSIDRMKLSGFALGRSVGIQYGLATPRNMKIVAISNQKGGVGKTTTAVNLSACLEELGARVLMIDMDPQANGTSALGVEPPAAASLYRPLLGQGSAVDKILPTNMPNLSIIPAELELAGVEIE